MRGTIKILDVDFELCGTVYRSAQTLYYGFDVDAIYKVYVRPSRYKVEIWKSWCDWCRRVMENSDAGIYISSHTCNFFSISGFVTWEGNLYYLNITKAHNRAYLVV